MCGIPRIFAHPDFRSWLKSEVPAMPPLRPLTPQQATFWTRLGMSQVDPTNIGAAVRITSTYQIIGRRLSNIPLRFTAVAGGDR